MGLLLHSIKIQPVRWMVRRAYSGKSDVTANAMVFADYGQPSQVLKWHSYRLPALTADTVHVKFLASPINPADVNMIQGVYPIKPKFQKLGDESDELLAVGGNEGVAEVVAVGDDVSSLKVGDQVVMAKSGYGTWRTHAAGPASDFQLLPKANNVSLIQKATISVNPCTAYRMLKDFVDLKQGDYVIQNGGNSAVGQAVIQIAKAWGLNTINVVRNRPQIDQLTQELKDLGATHVVTDDKLGSHDMRKQIKSWVGSQSPLLGLNCVGGKSATEMARYIGANGHYVTYGAMSKSPLSLPASLLIFKNIHFHGFWVSKWSDVHSKEERYAMFEDIIQLMSQGKLKEPKWNQVEWDEETMKRSVEQGISGFATGKQVVLF
ncbi:Trans-2-enoyl-CoA reductase, mitochondrial [Choanephora cucurbitarum]|uniref:enoyl-[acyl-carrier-protein] reductase n=1 Tax=Choanephora cucurbitarum TaxID=101091 RepID=A0A1C7MX92_9FUNG|nr:Trans-2-enoyl-CoA reductase, mitochondrial [Choanephora cucurbitarum]